MPVAFGTPCHFAKFEHRRKRRFLAVQRDNTAAELNFPEGQIDNRSSGTLQKVHNRKADVKLVHILPEKGCLTWLHGTMSGSPWKSH